MSGLPDIDRTVTVTFDLATLLLFSEVTGFAGFHDPILEHLSERQQQALWTGNEILNRALRAENLPDWDAAEAAAAETWDMRLSRDGEPWLK